MARVSHAIAAGLVAVGAVGAQGGCGSGGPKPAAVERPSAERPARPARSSSDEEDGVELVSTQGKIDPDKVTAALSPRAGDIEACYAERVGRRRWLGGGVELRWDVAADGSITSVRLVGSDLGAWDIEKCVLGVAREVSFGRPAGGKAHVTTPLAFSNGAGAQAWSEEQTLRAVGGKAKELGACAEGQREPENVTVTMYVGTRGKVQSVGFAAPAGVDEGWADCAAERALAWALTDPRGKVAKLSWVYNPAATEADDDEAD